MKSCSSNRGAAYSPPMLVLSGIARKVLGKRRGGPMGRSVWLCRFTLAFSAILCFALGSRGSPKPAPPAYPETPEAQAAAPKTSSMQRPLSEANPAETKGTEQYILSRERGEKALAYS